MVKNNNSVKEKKEQSYYKFASKGIIEVKELDDELIVKGYIATTHQDKGFLDEERGVWIKDTIHKETLDTWKDLINDDSKSSRKVTYRHIQEQDAAGVGIRGSARVDLLPDGQHGLYAETKVSKTYHDYDKVKYEIDNDLTDSFSIEYMTRDMVTGEPLPNAFEEHVLNDGNIHRDLLPGIPLKGWTFAQMPMNDGTVMIKELIDNIHANTSDDDNILEEKEKMTEQEIVTENKEVPVISAEDQALLIEAKEAKKQTEMKEMLMGMLKDDSFKEVLNKEVKDPVILNTDKKESEEEEDKPEVSEETKEILSSIEYKDFKEVLDGKKEIAIEEKFKRAGLMAEKKGMVWADGVDTLDYKTSKEYTPVKGKAPSLQFKSFGTNGAKLEFKSLGITSNQNTDTDYLLSAAELKDMFDPVIYDVLNQSTTTWGLLRKDDFSAKGNNQVQFVLRTGANGTAAFYTGNSVSTSNGKRKKVMTKFKKAQAGISVDGDMVAAANGGPIGDVFGLEVQFGTEDLLAVINTALFAEVGLESASAIIGFEYITDSAGNTTLYNIARDGDKTSADYNGLSPDSAGDTYINGASARISTVNMAAAIEQAKKEGANLNDLIFLAHPTQVRLYKDIYRSMQRFAPTSARFGFENSTEFDSIPIFEDKAMNNDDWFLIDLASHRVAMWVPPTLTMLGKRSDADEGFIKTYFATYNWNPRRMVQIYANATS